MDRRPAGLFPDRLLAHLRLAAICSAAVCAISLAACGRQTALRAQAADVRPVPPASPAEGVLFEDTATAAGLTYRWPPLPNPANILQSLGYGCAFLDYDNDGRQDVLLAANPNPLLYRNMGGGRFEDVTARTGLTGLNGEWKGVAVGDYDGDGYLDLAITGYHCLALLHNEGGKGFRDATREAGLDPANRGRWGSSAGFMSLGESGRLDLVLLNYLRFGPHDREFCEKFGGVVDACAPSTYGAEFPQVWQNLGAGRFRDVTAASGLSASPGKGLVLAFADLDGAGRMGFYIGNDGEPADLMVNSGRMRFRDAALERGVAYAGTGKAMAAMSADWADYDRDGRLDLAVTNFADEPYAVFHNGERSLFTDAAAVTGVSEPTRKPLGFGAKWLDMDNDGWPDFAVANGHIYSNIEKQDPLSAFRQPMMLFHNREGRAFEDLAPRMGGAVAEPRLGRGMAAGDFDDDGRIDLLVVGLEDAPLLLHNTSTTGNHWISLDLRMPKGPNRFAYGAQVRARAAGAAFVGQVSPASSFMSSSDPRVHFGLGSAVRLDSLRIRWPDGVVQDLKNVPADRLWRISEGRAPTHAPTAAR